MLKIILTICLAISGQTKLTEILKRENRELRAENQELRAHNKLLRNHIAKLKQTTTQPTSKPTKQQLPKKQEKPRRFFTGKYFGNIEDTCVVKIKTTTEQYFRPKDQIFIQFRICGKDYKGIIPRRN